MRGIFDILNNSPLLASANIAYLSFISVAQITLRGNILSQLFFNRFRNIIRNLIYREKLQRIDLALLAKQIAAVIFAYINNIHNASRILRINTPSADGGSEEAVNGTAPVLKCRGIHLRVTRIIRTSFLATNIRHQFVKRLECINILSSAFSCC